MGNKYSTPYCFSYRKLASSSESQQFLLLDTGNNHSEYMELLKFEVDANLKKSNVSMERKNMAVEIDIRDLRSAISRIEQSAPVHEKNIAHLQKEVCELRSAVSRVESMVNPKGTPAANEREEPDLALKNDFDKLAIRLRKLELDSLWDHYRDDIAKMAKKNTELEERVKEMEIFIHQLKASSSSINDKKDIAKLSKKNSELEKRVVEMATTINEMKAVSSYSKNKEAMAKLVREKTELESYGERDSTIDHVKAALSSFDVTQSMGFLWPEPGCQGPGMSDLIRCLLVLIFLVCILIGINL